MLICFEQLQKKSNICDHKYSPPLDTDLSDVAW